MSSTLFALLALLATVVGALIPIQAATNAAMSRAVGGVAVSSLIVFTIGILVVGLWVALSRQGLPTMLALRQAPAICFIVTGQIVAAVIIDHLGAFGAVTHAFTLQRGAGVALMVAGLFVAMRQ
jgi:transporter family-2 protein